MKKLICEYCSKLFPSLRQRPYCSRPCYALGKKSAPIASRFWKHVQKAGPNDCWLWTGATHQYGYGRMGVGSRKNWRVVEAHRVSWEIHFGPIPSGLHVCHSCDNPPCVNPAHLFLGNNTDNRQDSVLKNRHAFGDRAGSRTHPEKLPRGEKHVNSKLTENIVREIRRSFEAGESNKTSLAKKYHVADSTIGLIIRRKAWKHIA